MKKIIPLLALCLLCACAGTTPQSAKPTITVTLEPLRYFAEAIAGPHYQVVSMVPKGSSPESYGPTPLQLVHLGQSQAYLRIGHIGFEQAWMKKLQAICPHMKVFDTSRGVELIHGQAHRHGDHYHEGGVDPHIWCSPRNAAIVAENICQALCQLDPTHQADYRQRLSALQQRIAQTHTRVLAHLENASSTFLIYHPSLTYFARDYGLQQLCIEDNGHPPTPAQLKALMDTCRRVDARVLFVQPEFDQRHARLVARQLGLHTVPIQPLSYDWAEEMVRVAKALKK